MKKYFLYLPFIHLFDKINPNSSGRSIPEYHYMKLNKIETNRYLKNVHD